MEDADGAGSHLPAVDDLSHDETEGSGSSEESDVFDVRRREDEPWSETASSSEDGHDDEEGDVIEAANDALLMELDQMLSPLPRRQVLRFDVLRRRPPRL